MSLLEAPENTPVWVVESNCKGCDICVEQCPAGVLGMNVDLTRTTGKMAAVDFPDSCIGCNACELACPDFAIFVADKKEFKFAKLSKDSKERAIKVKENGYESLLACN